jgi:hypothetical protein
VPHLPTKWIHLTHSVTFSALIQLFTNITLCDKESFSSLTRAVVLSACEEGSDKHSSTGGLDSLFSRYLYKNTIPNLLPVLFFFDSHNIIIVSTNSKDNTQSRTNLPYLSHSLNSRYPQLWPPRPTRIKATLTNRATRRIRQ